MTFHCPCSGPRRRRHTSKGAIPSARAGHTTHTSTAATPSALTTHDTYFNTLTTHEPLLNTLTTYDTYLNSRVTQLSDNQRHALGETPAAAAAPQRFRHCCAEAVPDGRGTGRLYLPRAARGPLTGGLGPTHGVGAATYNSNAGGGVATYNSWPQACALPGRACPRAPGVLR